MISTKVQAKNQQQNIGMYLLQSAIEFSKHKLKVLEIFQLCTLTINWFFIRILIPTHSVQMLSKTCTS